MRKLFKQVQVGSALWVFLHCVWRVRRGRRLSVSFDGCNNPEEAFRRACQLLRQKELCITLLQPETWCEIMDAIARQVPFLDLGVEKITVFVAHGSGKRCLGHYLLDPQKVAYCFTPAPRVAIKIIRMD